MINETIKTTKMLGHYKISLMKEDKVIHKESGNNFITKAGRELLRRAQANFVGTGITGLDSTIIYNSQYYDPFTRLILTNGGEIEKPEEDAFLWGDIIGHAVRQRPYSGFDEMLGTINPNESFVGRDRTHLVFDFPTHAANGEIKSLGFVGGTIEPGFQVYGAKKFEVIGSNSNPYLFGSQEENIVYSRVSLGNTLTLYDTDKMQVSQVDLGIRSTCLLNIDGDMYVAKTPHTSADIFKLSQDRQSITDEKFSLNKTIPDLRCMKLIKNEIYVFSVSPAVDLTTQLQYRESLYVFSKEGSFIKAVTLPNNEIVFGDRDCSQLSENTLTIPINKGYIYNMDTEEFKSSVNYLGLIFNDKREKRLMRIYSNLYEDFIPSLLMSKILLDEPIIKKDEYTMKVEYDFTY